MSLEILKRHQKAYEDKMEIIDRKGGTNKLQMQVDTLRSWVSDLVAQNALLVNVVEELEQEAISLVKDRRRYSENDNDIKIVHDRMQEKNLNKDREIRRLNQIIHEYKVTTQNLKKEMSALKRHDPEASSEDIDPVQVLSDTSNKCIKLELLKDYNAVILQENTKSEERIKTLEMKLKVSADNVRILRKKNVSLTVEIHALHHVYMTLNGKYKQVTAQSDFKDDLILELRRQLKQTKEELHKKKLEKAFPKDFVSGDHMEALNTKVSYDSVTIACVRQPRLRRRDIQAAIDDVRNTQLDTNAEFDYQAPREPCSAHELTQKSI